MLKHKASPFGIAPINIYEHDYLDGRENECLCPSSGAMQVSKLWFNQY